MGDFIEKLNVKVLQWTDKELEAFKRPMWNQIEWMNEWMNACTQKVTDISNSKKNINK